MELLELGFNKDPPTGNRATKTGLNKNPQTGNGETNKEIGTDRKIGTNEIGTNENRLPELLQTFPTQYEGIFKQKFMPMRASIQQSAPNISH